MKLARLALALLLAAPIARADVRLATASGDGMGNAMLDVWRVSARDVLHERSWMVAGDPSAVAVTRDGSRAAIAVGRPAEVVVASLDYSATLAIPLADRADAVEFYGDGTRVAVGMGTHVRTYDSISGSLLRDQDAHAPIRALASYPGVRSFLDPRSRVLIAVANPLLVLTDDDLLYLHPSTGEPFDQVDLHAGVDMRVLDDGRAFIRVTSGDVTILNLRTGDPAFPDAHVSIPPDSPWDVSADGKWIAYVEGRNVVLYDVAGDRVATTRERHDDVLQVILPDGPTRILLTEAPMAQGTILDVPSNSTAWHGNLAFRQWKSVTVTPSTDDHADLLDEVATRASQGSVDALAGSVATRASQSSVDALASAVASKSSQSSVNALATTVGTKASQSSVDALATAVAAKSSQSSVDAVASNVDGLATDLAARASQASVDALTSRVADVQATANSTNSRLDARLDAGVSSRASQASVDRLASDESDRADADAAEHDLILASVSGGARQQVEAALAAGVVQPIFLVPAGPDGDPAALGLTCPGLAAAGAPQVDADGLFETVRCVTRRAIDDLRAIGEDVRRAETDFSRGEADRQAARYRDAVSDYSSAMQSLARGH